MLAEANTSKSAQTIIRLRRPKKNSTILVEVQIEQIRSKGKSAQTIIRLRRPKKNSTILVEVQIEQIRSKGGLARREEHANAMSGIRSGFNLLLLLKRTCQTRGARERDVRHPIGFFSPLARGIMTGLTVENIRTRREKDGRTVSKINSGDFVRKNTGNILI
ncbi:hypothetical protein QE152_g29318 [Popillia japonica]|uniref:Uncharacterized protein n=1 Tax=Popillia japonica TaxID=7064 RepID=A0AAW1JIP3_POPJA